MGFPTWLAFNQNVNLNSFQSRLKVELHYSCKFFSVDGEIGEFIRGIHARGGGGSRSLIKLIRERSDARLSFRDGKKARRDEGSRDCCEPRERDLDHRVKLLRRFVNFYNLSSTYFMPRLFFALSSDLYEVPNNQLDEFCGALHLVAVVEEAILFFLISLCVLEKYQNLKM